MRATRAYTHDLNVMDVACFLFLIDAATMLVGRLNSDDVGWLGQHHNFFKKEKPRHIFSVATSVIFSQIIQINLGYKIGVGFNL